MMSAETSAIPCTTRKSLLPTAWTSSDPIPWSPNLYSTMKSPVMSSATLLPVLVRTGTDDGRSACPQRIRLVVSPFERATVMKSSCRVLPISARRKR